MTAGLSGEVMNCRVRSVEVAAPEIRIIRLESCDGSLFDWRAGQYASFRFCDFDARDYSIANAPGDDFLEVHIRRSGSGGVSDYICNDLKAGDTLDVQGAFGGAYYRESELYLERHFIELMHAHPNFRFITVISDPSENSGRRTGLVSDAVAADFQLLYGYQCYLAGPPVMVEASAHMLKLKTVPKYDIFADAFYTEAEMQAKGKPRPDW
jgi:naphthalene 1,2-dioxygenase ferredoxin reductase component